MSLMDYIKNKAKSDKKTIVLAEGNEPRTVAAAEIVKREGIASGIGVPASFPAGKREESLNLFRIQAAAVSFSVETSRISFFC